MEYKLTNAVWELTMKCNMRCQHCGSSCEDAMPDELTTEETLALCDDLKELGLSYTIKWWCIWWCLCGRIM